MSALHLVFSPAGWRACEPRRASGDAIVLLGDGVYVSSQARAGDAHVLEEDLTIRGLAAPADASLITYGDLVDLCAQHTPVVSWQDGT